jgi:hypothetical protein
VAVHDTLFDVHDDTVPVAKAMSSRQVPAAPAAAVAVAGRNRPVIVYLMWALLPSTTPLSEVVALKDPFGLIASCRMLTPMGVTDVGVHDNETVGMEMFSMLRPPGAT